MKKVLPLMLIFFAGSAMAATAPDSDTIYTWGYGPFMFQQLAGLSNMMGDGFAIKVAAVIGIFSLVFKKLLDPRTSHVLEVGRFFFLSVFIYFGFMVAVPGHSTYNIKDVTNGYAVQVTGIPLVVGKSFALFSSMEYLIAQAIEQSFSTPNSTQYANAGFAFPLAAHEAMANVRPVAPYIQQSMDEFVGNCLLYAIDEGAIDPVVLYNSAAVYDDMNVNDPSRVTIVYSAANLVGDIMGCDVAQSAIKTMLINEVGNMESVAAASMGAINKYSAVGNVVSNKASDVAMALFNMSKTSQEYIMQSAAINAMQSSFVNVAKVAGIDTYSLAYGTATAERQAQTNFLISGKLAQKYLPVLKGVLTLTIVGISWLLALFALAYFDMKYLWMVFSLQIWLMLWTPIAAIYNNIQLLMVQAILEPYSSVGSWYTLNNKSVVDNEVLSALSWMGYIGWLIPLFAYAISKGSDHAFTMMANSLSSAMGGATGQAAGEVARGNIQLGEVRAGHREVVANGSSYSEGAYGARSTEAFRQNGMIGTTEHTQWKDQSARTDNLGGKSVISDTAGNATSTNAVDSRVQGGINTQQAQTVTTAQSKIDTISDKQGETASAMMKQAYTATNGNTHTEEGSEGYTKTQRLDEVTRGAFTKAYNTDDTFRESVTKSLEAKLGAAGAMDFVKGLSKGRGSVRPNASGGWSAKDEEGTTHSFSDKETDTFERSLGESVSAQISSGQMQKTATSTSKNSSDSKEWNKGFSQMTEYGEQLKEENKKVNQAQKAITAADNMGADTSAALFNHVKANYNDKVDGEGNKVEGRDLSNREALDKFLTYGNQTLGEEERTRLDTVMGEFLSGQGATQDARTGNKNKLEPKEAANISMDGVPQPGHIEKKSANAKEAPLGIEENLGGVLSTIHDSKQPSTHVDPLKAKQENLETYMKNKNSAEAPTGSVEQEFKDSYQDVQFPMAGLYAGTAMGVLGSLFADGGGGKGNAPGPEQPRSPDEVAKTNEELKGKVEDLEAKRDGLTKEYNTKSDMSNTKLARSELSDMVGSRLSGMEPGSSGYDETRKLQSDIQGGKPVSRDDFVNAGFSEADLTDNGFDFKKGGSLGGEGKVVDFDTSGKNMRPEILSEISGDLDATKHDLGVTKASYDMSSKHQLALDGPDKPGRIQQALDAIDGGGGWKTKTSMAAGALIFGSQSETFANTLRAADPFEHLMGTSIDKSSELEYSQYGRGGNQDDGGHEYVYGNEPIRPGQVEPYKNETVK
ncbi:MAG: conjugal transfer protein TraG N-terminal domain-containing protein [Campylobacterota bacterium]|nr:conjugal transfer protein TraG N-terminal domain-containing protein [Campylobacterota bacterium]